MCESHNAVIYISILSNKNHLKNWGIETLPVIVKYVIESNSFPCVL